LDEIKKGKISKMYGNPVLVKPVRPADPYQEAQILNEKCEQKICQHHGLRFTA
jgi:hypothetical protein